MPITMMLWVCQRHGHVDYRILYQIYIHGNHKVHKAGVAQVGALVLGRLHRGGNGWYRLGQGSGPYESKRHSSIGVFDYLREISWTTMLCWKCIYS